MRVFCCLFVNVRSFLFLINVDLCPPWFAQAGFLFSGFTMNARSDERVTKGTIDDRHIDWKTVAGGACMLIVMVCSGLFAIAQDGIKELKTEKADKAVVTEQFNNVQNQLNSIQQSVDKIEKKLDSRDRELLEAIKSIKQQN